MCMYLCIYPRICLFIGQTLIVACLYSQGSGFFFIFYLLISNFFFTYYSLHCYSLYNLKYIDIVKWIKPK